MLLNDADDALIKNLHQFKECGSFSEDTDEIFGEKLENGRTGHFTEKKIRKTGSTDQKHKSGRPKHARTGENVITADELV